MLFELSYSSSSQSFCSVFFLFQSFTFQLNIRPSISVVRDGAVLLRAGNVASGVMVKSSLYSAASIVQTMELLEGRKLSLKIDLPHKDLLIANIR